MKTLTAVVAASALMMSQAGLAAEDLRDLAAPREDRAAAFVGATIRLQGGVTSAPRPTARLRMLSYRLYDDGRASHSSRFPRTVELGFRDRGGPKIFIAGKELSHSQQKLGMDRSSQVLVGILLLSAIVVGLFVLHEEAGLRVD